MASPLTNSGQHSATYRRYLTTAMTSKTMRTLMAAFKCYNMKLKLSIEDFEVT